MWNCEISLHNFTFFKGIILRWNQECEIVKFHSFTFFKSTIMRWNQECEIAKIHNFTFLKSIIMIWNCYNFIKIDYKKL